MQCDCLAHTVVDEAPVALLPGILGKLKKDDIPDGASFEVGTTKDGTIHLEWSGRIFRVGDSLEAEADYTWSRKYWYSPLDLEQYLDLVRRAVETRRRVQGDVELTHYDDDGAFIQLHYVIHTSAGDAAAAYERARKVAAEIDKAAERTADGVGKRIAEVAVRLLRLGLRTARPVSESGGNSAVSR